MMKNNLLADDMSGTTEEAKAFLEKAVKYLEKNGNEKAFKQFRNQNGEFIIKDLYIFAFKTNGICLVHPYKPHWEATNKIDLKVRGIEIIKKFVDALEKKKKGEIVTVEYKWQKPGERKLRTKISYLVKVNKDTFLGCGAYK